MIKLKLFSKRFTHGKNLKIMGKHSVHIDNNVKIGNNVTIYENNYIEGNTVIGDNVTLLPGNHITDTIIDNNVTIESSNLKEGTIHDGASIGPFARIRPKAVIGKNCKVGNFVEIKNATLGEGTKVSHLTYVGDATVGKNCNIGCGVIFVNYNGVLKNRSTVGDNCFIGSNVNVIAPVNIKNDSYICAGATVTKDTNEDDFVIGRIDNIIKEKYATKYLNKQRVIKEELSKKENK